MDVQKFMISGYRIIEKDVSIGGDSGRVYVPRKWIGKRVAIVLLEPEE